MHYDDIIHNIAFLTHQIALICLPIVQHVLRLVVPAVNLDITWLPMEIAFVSSNPA